MDRRAREEHMAKVWASNRLAPHPAPEVTARLATVDEIPRSVALLKERAEKAGWRAWVTYARGTLTKDTHGVRNRRVVDSIAIRLRHPDGRGAVAIYHDGKAEYGFTWNVNALTLPRRRKVTEVQQFVLWGNDAG